MTHAHITVRAALCEVASRRAVLEPHEKSPGNGAWIPCRPGFYRRRTTTATPANPSNTIIVVEGSGTDVGVRR